MICKFTKWKSSAANAFIILPPGMNDTDTIYFIIIHSRFTIVKCLIHAQYGGQCISTTTDDLDFLG